MCALNEVPVIFALNRRKLGKAMGRRSKVSCIGIYDISGANIQFKTLLKHVKAGKEVDVDDARSSDFFDRAIRAAEKEMEDERRRVEEAERPVLNLYKF